MGPYEKPWVARIKGSHPRFGWARCFMRPLKDFSGASRSFKGAMRGLVLEYLLPAGVYEICEHVGQRKRHEVRRFYQSDEGKLTEMTVQEVSKWIQQNAS